ncbi:MAG: AI-2E family transporter [Lachnospiraceae bacterium]|nr:AI-2E family transporter [Lachnospiraceae bacterium]
MENRTKRPITYMLIFSVFLAIAFHLDKLPHFFSYFIGITFPLLIGAVMAFILNVPMRGFEKLLDKMDKKNKMKDGVKIAISLILTIISMLLIIALVIVIMVPSLVSSIKQMYETLREQLPNIIKTLESLDIDAEWVESVLSEKSWQEWLGLVGNSAGNVLGKVMSGTTTALSGVGSAGIGIVICVYILIDKRALGRRFTKLLGLIFKEETKEKVIKLGRTISDTYSSFLTGQCLEAVILGVLMFIALTIFRVPYAALISVLAGVFSFIPFIGSFLACGFGALLIVLTNPIMALVEIAVFLVVQFVEGQFIYPRVVGDSVGLPAIFTLIAAILGGEILGVIGMIFAIPMTAVIYTLLRDMSKEKDAQRITVETVKAVEENEAESEEIKEDESEADE